MIQHALVAWLEAVPLRRRAVAFLRAQPVPVYLVGGTVRDALLGRESYDLDLTVEGNALALARRLADHLHAAYVPLDQTRDVARVVARGSEGPQQFDLAGLRAQDIVADLWARDYTVNAMAVRLENGLGELIDPTGGRADLEAGLLRVVQESAFEDDPLRILRGVRLRGTLGFEMTPETVALAHAWLPALVRVSAERIRDELVQLLALEEAAGSLRYAADLGALAAALPALQGSVAAGGIAAVAALEALFNPWSPGEQPLKPLAVPLLQAQLGPYARALRGYWGEVLSSERTRWLAFKLAALLSALSEGLAAGETLPRLRLSRNESRFIAAVLAALPRLRAWLAGGLAQPAPLEVYRYYRALGEGGVGGALLALAQGWAEGLPGVDNVAWERLMACVTQLMRAWFQERAALVDPPVLLSGNDLLRALKLKPGPLLSELLERVREAQVQGLVTTREQALQYLRAYLAARR